MSLCTGSSRLSAADSPLCFSGLDPSHHPHCCILYLITHVWGPQWGVWGFGELFLWRRAPETQCWYLACRDIGVLWETTQPFKVVVDVLPICRWCFTSLFSFWECFSYCQNTYSTYSECMNRMWFRTSEGFLKKCLCFSANKIVFYSFMLSIETGFLFSLVVMVML